MDKLKKNIGYVGLGLLGGLIGNILFIVFSGHVFHFPSNLLIMYTDDTIIYQAFIFAQILGGVLGGNISGKWWGALIGGFILTGLGWFISSILW